MIVWIDGPYGIGKTTIADELVKNHKELIRIESDECFIKFAENQPYDAFSGGTTPQTNLSFLKYIRQQIIESISKDIIVVMALTTREAKEILVDYFMDKKVRSYHFILEADRNIILSRIKNDDSGRDRKFAESHLDENLRFLNLHYADAIRVETDREIDKIVRCIEKYID